MANNRSAKKRIKINRRNNIQNNAYKSLIKYYEKMHLNLLQEYQNSEDFVAGQSIPDNIKKTLTESFALVASRIDRAVKKKLSTEILELEKKITYLKKLLKLYNL